MADFSHLKAHAVTRDTTREYTFNMLEGEPSVIVAPACDDNEDYLNTRLELMLAEIPAEEEGGKRKQAAKAAEKLTPELLRRQYEEGRELDRKLLSRACARAWGTPPVDVKGKAVVFSADNAYDFFKALPDYMFDPFRHFCGNVLNFAPKPKADGSALGNS